MKKKIIIVLIIFLSFLLSYLGQVAFPGFYNRNVFSVRDSFYKLRYLLQGSTEVSPHFMILLIDDVFISEYGGDGDSRDIWAEIVTFFSRAGVKTLVFDILFRDGREADRGFAEAIEAGPGVIFPVSLVPGPREIPPSVLKELSTKFFWSPEIEKQGRAIVSGIFQPPFPPLAAKAAGLGTIRLTPDDDGISRRIPLVVGYKDRYIPSLALAAICDFLNVSREEVVISFGKQIKLTGSSLYGEPIDLSIPIDEQGCMIINFAGPWSDSIEMYSMADFFQLYRENPEKLEEYLPLENTIVMLADVTREKNDFGRGIFDNRYSNNGVLSNTLNTILTDNYIREPGLLENIIISCCFMLLIYLGYHFLKWRPLIFSCLLFIIIVIVVNLLLFLTVNRLPSLFLQIWGTVFSLILIALLESLIPPGKQKSSPLFEEMKPASIQTKIPLVVLNEKACREFNISRQQREILIKLQRGYTYKQIAHMLEVKEGTIKKQVGRIKEKTDLYYKKDILETFFPLT